MMALIVVARVVLVAGIPAGNAGEWRQILHLPRSVLKTMAAAVAAAAAVAVIKVTAVVGVVVVAIGTTAGLFQLVLLAAAVRPL